MAAPISQNDRTRWLEMLQLAAESQPGDDHSLRVIYELGLPPEFDPYVVTAVKDRRWQDAENPRAYVKAVARRLVHKAHVQSGRPVKFIYPSSGSKVVPLEEALGNLYMQSSAQASKRSDGVWRRGEGNYEDEELDDEGVRLSDISYRDHMLARVPTGFKKIIAISPQQQAEIDRINELLSDIHIPTEPQVEVDWEGWAKDAGLDKWECKVLLCKLSQISRDQAMENQATEDDRKALQAAWRRFDRGGCRKLRDSAKKILVDKRPERSNSRH